MNIQLIQQFLKHNWQQKHHVFRDFLTNYQIPISLNEIAGLACEEGVDARIIEQSVAQDSDSGSSTKFQDNWKVMFGPFDAELFQQLGQSNWILLINEFNHYVDMDPLLNQFTFIPSWRFDDIMVSYSVCGGSVGPHVDQYDVFLFQVHGTKRWDIAYDFSEQTIADLPVHILAEFTPEQSFDLEAGDVLYLPPGVAHHGIAMEDNLTLSIGFRAPDRYQLLIDYFAQQTHKDLYTDPNPSLCDYGEISQQAIHRLLHLVKKQFLDENHFVHWFTKYISESFAEWETNEMKLSEIQAHMQKENITIKRHHATKIYYYRDLHGKMFLTINGQQLPVDDDQQKWIKYICNHRSIETSHLPKENMNFFNMLARFIKQGYFIFC